MAQVVGGTDKTVWYSSCVTIMTVALNPPISQAADYWGRKAILVALSLIGAVGSIIAGFAILGLSFGSQSVVLTVLSEVLPRKYRPMGQASSSVAASLGGIIGLLMGGGLLQHGNLNNYRIYWYIEAGLYAIAALGCLIGYNPPVRELQASLSTSEKLKHLDWVGYFIFAPGLALFSRALSWSKNPYSWNSANIMSPFIISVAGTIIFFIYEWRFKKDGVLHHGLWHNRNFAVSLLVIFIEGLSFFAVNSYFAYEVMVLYDASIFLAGANFSIMFITGLVSPQCSGCGHQRARQ